MNIRGDVQNQLNKNKNKIYHMLFNHSLAFTFNILIPVMYTFFPKTL